ncbi:MAG: IS110 family transposase [Mariprofundus sp.]|nr:IS110 family transposase [Mariprofundus sp.]
MSREAIIDVGIDVSARKLDLSVRYNKQWVHAEFENSDHGHKAIIRYIIKRAKSARVCVEATGIYHLELCLALHKTRCIKVMVINPRVAKDFSKAIMQRSKTDAMDSHMLAEFSERMEFISWQPPREDVLELRAIARRMDALARQRAAEKNRLHVACSKLVATDIKVNIRHLQRRIEQLQSKAIELIEQDGELLKIFTLITTIKGVAELSAIRIMGEILVLPEDMKARQWVAHAGLDPRTFESGSSVRKTTRISKVGNARLRHALYMPALSAARNDEYVRAFRNQLIEKGCKPMQATVAIMRKMLTSIYGMLKSQTTYKPELFYQANSNA